MDTKYLKCSNTFLAGCISIHHFLKKSTLRRWKTDIILCLFFVSFYIERTRENKKITCRNCSSLYSVALAFLPRLPTSCVTKERNLCINIICVPVKLSTEIQNYWDIRKCEDLWGDNIRLFHVQLFHIIVIVVFLFELFFFSYTCF